MTMRDDRIGQKLQVGFVRKRDGLGLRRIVGIHRVNLGGRLRGDMRLCARTERHVEGESISLQQTSRGGDQEHGRQVWHRLVAIERTLHHVG